MLTHFGEMEAQWKSLVAKLVKDSERFETAENVSALGDKWWKWIQGHYDEDPVRHYHTSRHVGEILALLPPEEGQGGAGVVELQTGVRSREVCAVTAWFHDVVYDPRATDGGNEIASADAAVEFLHEAGLEMKPGEGWGLVKPYILATIKHEAPEELADDGDLSWFLDADLGVLAADESRYKEYSGQIRAEYAHVPWEAYVSGRTGVLERLKSRGYVHPLMEGKRGALVRNLEWEIGWLRSQKTG